MCFSRHKTRQPQSTRARSWFFLSLYCLYKNAAEKKIIEDKIKELTANKQPYCYRSGVTDFFSRGLSSRLCETQSQSALCERRFGTAIQQVKKTYKGKLKPNH
jgi:peptide-methionine (S)-S-oxide reductase